MSQFNSELKIILNDIIGRLFQNTENLSSLKEEIEDLKGSSSSLYNSIQVCISTIVNFCQSN